MGTPPEIHRCPHCDGVGQPFRVETISNGVLVHLRCPYCGATWQEPRLHVKPQEPR